MPNEPSKTEPDTPCGDDLDLSGYSPNAREAIRRRLAEKSEDGPDRDVFESAVTRTAEESQDDREGD